MQHGLKKHELFLKVKSICFCQRCQCLSSLVPDKRVRWRRSLNRGHRNHTIKKLINFILTVILVLFSVFFLPWLLHVACCTLYCQINIKMNSSANQDYLKHCIISFLNKIQLLGQWRLKGLDLNAVNKEVMLGVKREQQNRKQSLF